MTTLRTLAAASLAAALLAGCPKEIPIPVDPPEARKDYARTAVDTPVILSPLLNDHDPNSEVMTIVGIGAAANGTAVLAGNTVTYTPNLGFTGGDSFTVTITDASGHEATESAYVTVGPSSRFLFVSNFQDYYTRELYIADSAHPGIALPLSGRVQRTVGPFRPLQGMPDSSLVQFVVSPDGEAVLYWSDDNSERAVFNLFYAELDTPGVAVKLTDFNEDDFRQASSLVIPMVISPDKQYAYYLSNEFSEFANDLVRIEIANPANKVVMNAPLTELTVTPEDIRRDNILNFKLTDDGQRLLVTRFNHSELAPAVGANVLQVIDNATPGVATKVSGTATSGTNGATSSFVFVPGTDQALYLGSEGGSTVTELWLVDYVAQTAPVKLSGTALGSGVTSFRVSPDGSRAVYIGTEHTTLVRELYTVELANPGVTTRISKPRTVSLGADFGFLIGPDNSYAVYLRDDDTAETVEIYKVDFATPTIQTKLNHTLRTRPPGVIKEQVQQVQVSAGMPRTVLFSTNNDFVKNEEVRQTLWRVSIDTPTVVSAVGTPTQVKYLVLWSADGENVTKFDDPEELGVISAFRTTLTAPTVQVKQTPERYLGALAEVSLSYPFLP